MEMRIYNDLSVYGSIIFAKDESELPPGIPGQIVSMNQRHYAYTKISDTFSSWLPLGNKQTAFVHAMDITMPLASCVVYGVYQTVRYKSIKSTLIF